MRHLLPLVFVIAATAAAALPHVVRPGEPRPAKAGFPGWPASYEGRTLSPLPLTARETALARDLPGRIARFTDGEREIVLRWVVGVTRQLHPVAGCFRGIGWRVATAPMRLAADGVPMSCMTATGPDGRRLSVCEQIRSTTGRRAFSDVSSWYWHALWQGEREAWWSTVVATPVP